MLRGDDGVTDQPSPAAPASAERQSGAARGVLYIAFAKFYFMFAGLFVQLRLPAILSNSAWGSYSFINSLVSPVIWPQTSSR